MREIKDIAIVGAGLGGLTSAIALRRQGFNATVYEQSSSLSEIGAGVQLSPNAMKVLRALGLEDEFRKISFEPDRHVVRSWKSGRVISATQMKNVYEREFGSGYFGAHRADLHKLLAHALPEGTIRLNANCIDVGTVDNHAVLKFTDGAEIRADIAVGADGIHSNVRNCLFGKESPRFTGNVCWRGLVPVEDVPKGMFAPDMTVWFGPNSNVVHYYVRGGKLINWVASHESDWSTESWRSEASIAEVVEAYKDWHPDLTKLFAATKHCYKWALFDRSPLSNWSKGRVTLLGDSAHAMLPYLAQGACMAIEDAFALASSLAADRQEPNAALERYEGLRRDRASRVQSAANARAKVNHLTSRWARLKRDTAYAWRKLIKPSSHTYQIEWIYGYDVTKE
ncbi:FAD-dependent monooxygenase [Bradyrhizobium erythrophlei]|jgi:salicylate hydroxylase|uniref:Salicylate hydroxylase n=1 Tax=Bradyrhizobium erythrophlei TaxID=1437360 RepID=A0A1M5WHE0_9BRAD|nr:FAD-dependent monooxygenase [Bradyrhizobium erythrophlei]SHH86910.1 salicylate hydroxylase [Bradyrhizobium erythrophlei]